MQDKKEKCEFESFDIWHWEGRNLDRINILLGRISLFLKRISYKYVSDASLGS
jgi:hypothetical protein